MYMPSYRFKKISTGWEKSEIRQIILVSLNLNENIVVLDIVLIWKKHERVLSCINQKRKDVQSCIPVFSLYNLVFKVLVVLVYHINEGRPVPCLSSGRLNGFDIVIIVFATKPPEVSWSFFNIFSFLHQLIITRHRA